MSDKTEEFLFAKMENMNHLIKGNDQKKIFVREKRCCLFTGNDISEYINKLQRK